MVKYFMTLIFIYRVLSSLMSGFHEALKSVFADLQIGQGRMDLFCSPSSWTYDVSSR